jgi:hypothetical protein
MIIHKDKRDWKIEVVLVIKFKFYLKYSLQRIKHNYIKYKVSGEAIDLSESFISSSSHFVSVKFYYTWLYIGDASWLSSLIENQLWGASLI